MYREDGESTDNIYENDVTREDSTQGKSSELTVIVLCVIFTQDRQQLISKNEIMSSEREQLRNELLTLDEWIYYQSSFYHLSTERKNWDDSRQDCQKRGADLIIINNREENVVLDHIWVFQTAPQYCNIGSERTYSKFGQETTDSNATRIQSSELTDGWIYYQSSFYFISPDGKNWTESRRYCTERGADLLIVNNNEEQDFVKNISGKNVVWIGLTDSDVEGRWKWVNGSTLTYGWEIIELNQISCNTVNDTHRKQH
ncbi:hypothetical protein cypCar_00006785 [Cyprinus carpio]|nr:hypothetical protein cypCar_00006785 [Cyprinus carpio]